MLVGDAAGRKGQAAFEGGENRVKEYIQKMIAAMTLEEKASLCSGLDSFRLKGVKRLGIPSVLLSDGPHGLRIKAHDPDHLGAEQCIPSTCFPTASATASSWDRNLMYEIGRALGEEALREDVAAILGPGINIKRSPLCGRNFEYFSEDPFLAGELAASLIEGVQSMGVGTALKHYAVNNQETRRMTIDAIVDERTLREIYLAGFELAVKKAGPWSVMSSYNKVNGISASEHEGLNDILRKEWGYRGLVMTDWGACADRISGLRAGQDLEMPASGGKNDAKIVRAVRDGTLDEAVLDRTVARLLVFISRAVENRQPDYFYDKNLHHVIARQAAAESVVLLKNEDGLLPLKKGTNIAVIGDFAVRPRVMGGGSSKVNPCRLEKAYGELISYTTHATFSRGYDLKADAPEEELIERACAAAKSADVAIVFAGLPDHCEVEGLDRENMRLPESHNELIRRVAEVNPATVVVLFNGAPVEMPWLGSVKAVLEGYLGGQAGGGAVADVLFGMVNPSGKLAETFALKAENYPSARYFPSGPKTVEYREGIYVGYRYFDTAKKAVMFPFGYGLSYTTFAYSGVEIGSRRIRDDEELKVSISVKNTGELAGAEVVQLYVRDKESTIFRPEKELKGFDKVFLQPGEETRLEFTLGKRAFAYYNTEIADWHVESGEFEILIGASSADIRARETVVVESTRPDAPVPDLRKKAEVYYNLPADDLIVADEAFRAIYGRELPPNRREPGEPYTTSSTLSEVKEDFFGRIFYNIIQGNIQKAVLENDEGEPLEIITGKMIDDMPLRILPLYSNGLITDERVEALLEIINKKPLIGFIHLGEALLKI